MSGVSEIQFLGLTHKPTLNLEHQYFVLLSYPEGKTRALRKLFPPVGKRPFLENGSVSWWKGLCFSGKAFICQGLTVINCFE
jgi:hypothetical protein